MALTAAAGCTVGPDYKVPHQRVPEEWSETESHVITTCPAEDTAWWTSLSDPMLNVLIERAVLSNVNLRIAEARVLRARAQRNVVAADLWPQAEVAGAYAYIGDSLNEKAGGSDDSVGQLLRDAIVNEAADDVFDGSSDPSAFAADTLGETLGNKLVGGSEQSKVGRTRSLFEGGFDATWELDMFGGIRRKVEAAEAEIDATEEYSRLVLVTLLSEVARNYVEARGYQNRISVARKNIVAQEEALELTRVRFEGGLAGELDVAQAKAQLASTRSAMPTLESSFRQAVHRLGVLLGEYPTALVKDLETDGPVPIPPPEISVGLPSELLQRRPDIRRSERLLAAATAQIGVATADLFPRFYLLGSFGSQAYDFRNFLDHSSLFWSVGPSVSWPILDAGRIRANVESQNAVQQEALAQYELTVLTALEEVENALTAYQREHLRRRHLSEAVEASRRALDLANERYVAGVADFLTVLDSERSLYKTEDKLVQSTTATTLHAIALYKALGGGW